MRAHAHCVCVSRARAWIPDSTNRPSAWPAGYEARPRLTGTGTVYHTASVRSILRAPFLTVRRPYGLRLPDIPKRAREYSPSASVMHNHAIALLCAHGNHINALT